MIISEKLIKCTKNIKKLIKKVVSFFKVSKNAPKSIPENKTNKVNTIEVDVDNASAKYLSIPSLLEGFTNTNTTSEKIDENRSLYQFNGILTINDSDYICPKCGHKMHINNSHQITLKHLCFGGNLTRVCFNHTQFYCENCHNTNMQNISFKADNHRITTELYNYVRDLLATGHYTNKEVAEITGLNRNIVKDIDKKRLEEKYIINGELIKPERQAIYLGIDEFKLHNGYKYATHIIDLETGHILWIQEGKKKRVVYDFINHVGSEWMGKVKAVACDMNSDFEEAFREKCPNITIVFDYFHIIKNYNEKVISAIRKDEQKRLKEEGKTEEAKTLKRSKYILTSSLSTLIKKDKEAENGKVIDKGSELFKKAPVKRTGSKVDKYNKILEENELLFTAELIKEKIQHAYTLTNENEMKLEIEEIIDMCETNGNKHLLWFAKLLKSHMYGITSHAKYNISTGKIEGINNKIKTLRRQAYGYPDDEYFFLKLFDISRTK